MLERLAQGRDLHRQVLLLDRGIRPDRVHDLALGDQIARAAGQHAEQVERPRADRDGNSKTGGVEPECTSGAAVHPEAGEFEDAVGRCTIWAYDGHCCATPGSLFTSRAPDLGGARAFIWPISHCGDQRAFRTIYRIWANFTMTGWPFCRRRAQNVSRNPEEMEKPCDLAFQLRRREGMAKVECFGGWRWRWPRRRSRGSRVCGADNVYLGPVQGDAALAAGPAAFSADAISVTNYIRTPTSTTSRLCGKPSRASQIQTINGFTLGGVSVTAPGLNSSYGLYFRINPAGSFPINASGTVVGPAVYSLLDMQLVADVGYDDGSVVNNSAGIGFSSAAGVTNDVVLATGSLVSASLAVSPTGTRNAHY